ncbi:MAG: alpha/beta fold hydrolase [Sulfitobacter sp.]
MNPQAGFTPHVTTLGQGPRRVLALHCTMAFGGAWAGLAKHLGGDLTMIAPDMPSHGQSADWDETSSFVDTVFQAAAEQLGPEPMDVIAHSFGAAIALRLAVAMPERIRSLSLFEPVLFAVGAAEQPETMRDHDIQAQDFMDAFAARDNPNAARLFNRMWGAGARWDSLPERSRAAMVRAIHVLPDTFGFIYDDRCGLMQPGALDAVDLPCLLMHGAQTLPVVKATNAGLVRRMGNTRAVEIAGAGHMGPVTHAAEVAQQIADFLPR